MTDWLNKTHVGDCRGLLAEMAAAGVRSQMCVTSPPYWNLRDYGVAGQIGLEPTIEEWVDRMVEVFRGVRDVLTDDGTLWLNLGDSYSSGGRGGNPSEVTSGLQGSQASQLASIVKRSACRPAELKEKELIGQPWRVAFALQADGWYLRSDIIWHKPNAMPESVKDRPTKAHEYIFLLSKSARYHYDATAIADPRSSAGAYPQTAGWATEPGATRTPLAHARDKGDRKTFRGGGKYANGASFSADGRPNKQSGNRDIDGKTRNARTVWTISTQAFMEAHFATFPEALVRRCVLAGSRPGATVLDPFMGSGTVGKVATDLGRQFIGCELNPAYVEMHESRRTTIGMAI